MSIGDLLDSEWDKEFIDIYRQAVGKLKILH